MVDFAEPNQQMALVTAKDARTPRNNSRRERARVARIVEVQKASGALFQDMKFRIDPIPLRLSAEKGLITAADARKPRNRTYKEQQRVKKVREAQRKSGAAKPSASTILDWERTGRRRRRQTGKTSGKQTAPTGNETTPSSTSGKQTAPSRSKPRAYETKISRRESIEEIPGIYRITKVPRYAAGARRPVSVNIGGRKVLTLDGVLQEPTYTLKLEPTTAWKSINAKKAVETAKSKKQKGKKQSVEEIKEQQRRRNIGKEARELDFPIYDDIPYWFEKYDVNAFVKTLSTDLTRRSSEPNYKTSTHTQRKNSGAAKTVDGKTIFTNSKGEQFVEVDNGNGTKARVRVNPSETGSQKADKGTSQKRKGKTIAEKPAPKHNNRKTGGKTAGTKQSANQQSQTMKKRDAVRIISGGQTNISGAAQNLIVLKKQIKNGDSVSEGEGTTSTEGDSSVTGNTTTTTNTPASTTQVKVSSRVKSAVKGEDIGSPAPRGRPKPKAAPAVRPKKKKPIAKTTEDDKKKQRKKIKKMKDDAFRFETVNTFGWITDNKPAAKPRKIK